MPYRETLVEWTIRLLGEQKEKIMAAKSPLQTIKSDFENRENIVSKLVEMVDDLHDEGAEGLKVRISRLSNKKLLRLYTIENKVREQYGDREKLIDHLIAARKEAGLTADDNYRRVLTGYSKGRLWTLRDKVAPRAQKLTPEQRLKNKRGRKERERALSKIGQR